MLLFWPGHVHFILKSKLYEKRIVQLCHTFSEHEINYVPFQYKLKLTNEKFLHNISSIYYLWCRSQSTASLYLSLPWVWNYDPLITDNWVDSRDAGASSKIFQHPLPIFGVGHKVLMLPSIYWMIADICILSVCHSLSLMSNWLRSSFKRKLLLFAYCP